MKKKNIRLYSTAVPLWVLTVLPVYWWITVPGNLIIDSVALLLAVWVMKLENRKAFFKKHILKLFCLGFLSDFIAALLMAGIYSAGMVGPSAFSMKVKLPGFVLATVLLGLVNYFFVFSDQDRKVRNRLSLFLTIATAPYTFLF